MNKSQYSRIAYTSPQLLGLYRSISKISATCSQVPKTRNAPTRVGKVLATTCKAWLDMVNLLPLGNESRIKVKFYLQFDDQMTIFVPFLHTRITQYMVIFD